MKTASICRILKNAFANPLTLNTTNIPDPIPNGGTEPMPIPAKVNLAPIPFVTQVITVISDHKIIAEKNIISLDLCNMLLEYGTNAGDLPPYAGVGDIQPFQEFVSYDFNNINISFYPDDGSGPVLIGSIYNSNYTMGQFISNAGVYDLALPPGLKAQEGIFSVWLNGVEMLYEVDHYLVSDQAGIYSEQNPQPASNFMSDGLPLAPCYLRVFKRGVPVPEADAFNYIFQACNLGAWTSTNMSLKIYDGVPLTLPVSDDGCITYVFPTNADEYFPKSPSLAALTYLAMNSSMVVCRVLADDPSLAPYLNGEQAITWEVVYEKVLKLYKMIYPIMDVILPINEATWGDAFIGEKIKNLTDETNWQFPLYMPVTRDMSAAQRKLLWMWIDQVNQSNVKAHAEKN